LTLSATIPPFFLSSFAIDSQTGVGADAGDPTFWAIAGAFVVALLWAGVVVVAKRNRRRAPRPGDLMRGGKVDVSYFRAIDLVGVAWIVGIYVWLSLAQTLAASAVDQQRVMGMADLWVSIGFQCVMASMVVFVMAPRARAMVWLGLRWQGWRSQIALAPATVVAMWLVFGVLETAGYMRWLESFGIDTLQDSVRALQKRDDVAFLVLMQFSAIVVAPICEEVVFRGYLYGVAKRYCGPVAAALCTALIFSAAHASLVALLPLAIFGLLLAWLYERTGSLWAPIASHACFNAVTVVLVMLRESQ